MRDRLQQNHDALSANVAVFASPSVTLSAIQTAVDNFTAALNAWGEPGNRGSQADHHLVVTNRNIVRDIIRSLCGYVDGIAIASSDPEATIRLAAMIPNSDKSPIGTLPAVQNLHAPYSKKTQRGEYRLRWKPVKGAKSYNVYVGSGSDTNPDNAVLKMEVTPTLAIYSSADAPPGTLINVWVRAVGSAGPGVVSDILSVRNV